MFRENRLMRSLTGAAFVLAVVTAPAVQAHLALQTPMARSGDYDLTEAPCGGIPAGSPKAIYKAGSDVTLSVDLAVAHVADMKVYISYNDFASRTELATVQTPESGIYAVDVSLPVQPAGPATLQVTDGTYVSCADITVTNAAPFEINSGLNDAWYYPVTDGQGFFIIVFPDLPLVFLSWFTFETERPPEDLQAVIGEPGHRWITASGPFEGDTAVLDITLTRGGIFDQAEPKAEHSEPDSVGTMEVKFENCYSGMVAYDMPGLGLAGEVPIQRIVHDNVPLCQALGYPE